MLIVSGAILVLLTWALATAGLLSLGMLIAALSSPGAARSEVLRGSLWWGLLVTAVLAYAVNLFLPLQSLGAGLALLVAVVILGVPGWWLWSRRRSGLPARGLWLAAAAGVVAVTLAFSAIGPVTNYDSGLYHLQAIRYTADFATVPGLASVYFPLGYSNAEFPLAALMGVGPWGLDGYRLINGLVIMLALIDLVVRARSGRRGAGFFALLTGVGVVGVTMLPLADYWVTSPTQDSTVFVVTMVATAYVADTVTRRRWTSSAGVLVALALLLVLLRPTMVAFAGGIAAVLVIVAWRRRRDTTRLELGRLLAVGVVSAVVAGLVSTARDYVLSGWLLYPLSVYSFDVPWLAPDPTSARIATLGAARNPEDLWAAAQGWDWIPSWFARLPSQWETYAIGLLAITAILTTLTAARATSLRGRGLLLVLAPSLLATAFWWAMTPPSFRFAWGVVFSLATIPIGWSLWRLDRAQQSVLPKFAITGGAVVLVAVGFFTLGVRVDYASMTDERDWRVGLSVPLVVSPPDPGDTAIVTTESGLEALVPRTGDQCWLAFPTCSPQLRDTLRLRGEDIRLGYLP